MVTSDDGSREFIEGEGLAQDVRTEARTQTRWDGRGSKGSPTVDVAGSRDRTIGRVPHWTPSCLSGSSVPVVLLMGCLPRKFWGGRLGVQPQELPMPV